MLALHELCDAYGSCRFLKAGVSKQTVQTCCYIAILVGFIEVRITMWGWWSTRMIVFLYLSHGL